MVRKWPVVTHLLPLKPLAQRILGVRGWGTAHMIHKWPVVIHLLPSTSRWRMGAAHLVPNSSVGTPSCPLAFNWVYQHLCVGWVQNPMVRNFHAHDSIPFHCIPFHSAPCHSIPFHCVQFHSIPFDPIPSESDASQIPTCRFPNLEPPIGLGGMRES